MAEEDIGSTGNEAPAGAQAPPATDPRIGELSRESASYRTQRNEALRRAHAYETMLTAHGVDISGVTADKLDKLPISGGAVDGQFPYTPPKVDVPRNAQTGRFEGQAPLTLAEIETWPADQINQRWDEVQAVLARTGDA